MWPGLALPMFLIYLSGRHGLSPAGQKRHFSRNFIVTFKKLILFSQPSCRVAQAFQWLSWNGIFSICAFPCCCWTLSPLELQSEHALPVNHSDPNSSRCSSNTGMDISSWEKIKAIKVCFWKCPSSIYVLFCMFLLPFLLSTHTEVDCVSFWNFPHQQLLFPV